MRHLATRGTHPARWCHQPSILPLASASGATWPLAPVPAKDRNLTQCSLVPNPGACKYDWTSSALRASMGHAPDGTSETVRLIFGRYAALGSVRLLKAELDPTGIRSKSWVSSSGRSWGGKPLARGALYLMLRNRIYRGEIVHKEQHYPGEHETIVDEMLWQEVQRKLVLNAVEC